MPKFWWIDGHGVVQLPIKSLPSQTFPSQPIFENILKALIFSPTQNGNVLSYQKVRNCFILGVNKATEKVLLFRQYVRVKRKPFYTMFGVVAILS